MKKLGFLNKLIEADIMQILIDHKIAYPEYLSKSLKELFVKYLKLQKK